MPALNLDRTSVAGRSLTTAEVQGLRQVREAGADTVTVRRPACSMALRSSTSGANPSKRWPEGVA